MLVVGFSSGQEPVGVEDVARERNPELFLPWDEFETSAEYRQRVANQEALIKDLRAQLLAEQKARKKERERLAAERAAEEERQLQIKIAESLVPVEFTPSGLGRYDADEVTFPLTVNGQTYIVAIPRSEARDFKANYTTAKVEGYMQLQRDLKTYDYFDLVVIHPITGSRFPLATEQDLACQEKYEESEEKYRDEKYEETVTILEELLQMEGCDEELSSKSQYLIGWNYGNKQFKMDAAKEAYQKAVDNYTSGIKYVEKSKEKLAHYKISDEAEAAYNEDDFQKAVELKEEVARLEKKKSDKGLRAKNQYYTGVIYQKKLNDPDKAKEAYQKVIDNYAGSKYVAKAEEKLKALQESSWRPYIEFIAYDDPPIPIGGYRSIQKNIIYPEIAQEAGIEGKVIIQAFIDKKGRVQEMSVLKGIPNTGLNEAAMVAIKKTRFKPAQQRNRPVGVYISIPVNFKLKG